MTTIATGNRRLLKLAAFLRTLPRERFNYAIFVGNDWGGAPDLSCGTAACALGWATAMPEFRRLGLRLSSSGIPEVRGSLADGTAAATDIFALSEQESLDLFYPAWDDVRATAKQVAAKIERFVRGRQ